MKHLYITFLTCVGAFLFGVQDAQALCACVCVEGTAKTICNDIEEANSDANVCVSMSSSMECPDPVGTIDPTVSDPIPNGAENCVRARLYDPATDQYSLEANVCDVASS